MINQTRNISYFYELAVIQVGAKLFRMNRPIPYRIDFYEGESYLANDELGIFCHVDKHSNALGELRQELIYTLEEYGLELDELLTRDAIELKHSINRYFSEVLNN